ncbi:NAD(P)-binding protein [Aspergillus saccharolyticus JOP 1030-1]|uniref:NAD(P)-binding protein n=1 Tax=Aspergillus saccharolyticus JOP 1030-1 TaxID=1450539 RepID=A0A318ZNK2_9EURO|nr:NAD(P)-binding protein [Aspergillus saccharolyticus JOP 1030-1]PYH48557.1 NAD(P)-binding protein [Aspergillus saccharolyticus JOP 1030-1]
MPTSLVTGGTGFIALHVVKLLLENGESVHATVRSLANTAKCKPLLDLQTQYPGRLSLFEADLLREGSFTSAMQSCRVVYHIASPFLAPPQIKNGMKECVEPALQGTRNVLESVNACESVHRVVLTSSIAALYSDSIEVTQMKDQTLCEAYWNETASPTNNPYHYSKVIAEREAWKLCKAQSRWDLVVLNPGLTLGPPLTTASTSGSLYTVDNIFSGANRQGTPELYYPVVDVRDVAEAHCKAGTSATAKGRRYLIAGDHTVGLLEMAELVRPIHRDPRVLPTRNLPKIMVYLAGPFIGVSRSWVSRNIGVNFKVDNGRSVRELGMAYIPVEKVVRDHYEAWLALKGEQ